MGRPCYARLGAAELGLQLPEGVFKAVVSIASTCGESFLHPNRCGLSGPGSSIRQLGLVLPLEANRGWQYHRFSQY